MGNKIVILIVVIMIILFIVFFIFTMINKKKFDFIVYFFNAGKADAILISKKDKYILIDAGEESCGDEIVQYLKEYNIKKLEALIITHFDKDHVGGAAKVIRHIDIDKILQSNITKDSIYYANYCKAVTDKSLIPTTVLENFDLSFDGLKIKVNGPSKVYEKSASNNSSLIVSVENENNKFLFMGDAEDDRIKDYIKKNKETYDFIKVPYHGKKLKWLGNLLDVVKAKYGVIICSHDKGCEKETIQELKKHHIKYYMTKNGSITVSSNGKDIIIK